jgi:hypothetical protein
LPGAVQFVPVLLPAPFFQVSRQAAEPTVAYEANYVEEILEPKVELHPYRRHAQRCRACEKTCQARGSSASDAFGGSAPPSPHFRYSTVDSPCGTCIQQNAVMA